MSRAPPAPPPTADPVDGDPQLAAGTKFTRATQLRVNKVLANSKHPVTCKTKRKKQQKKGCPQGQHDQADVGRPRVNL